VAIVTRFFSTVGAGAEDGTTWADRAPLFNSGVWSTIVSGFSFAGSDSLEVLVGPGTYTATAILSATPTNANPLLIHGYDATNARKLIPANQSWKSSEPFDATGMPLINSSVALLPNNAAISVRCCDFSFTGGAASLLGNLTAVDFCRLNHSTSSLTGSLFTGVTRLTNSYFETTATTFNSFIGSVSAYAHNCFFKAPSGSTGNRRLIDILNSFGNGLSQISNCTLYGGQFGIFMDTPNSTADIVLILNCTILNAAVDGIILSNTASQTRQNRIVNSYIANCGGFGINRRSAFPLLSNTRLRDNTSGNLSSAWGNYPIDAGIETTDSDDATELVDTSAGDFRIKNTSSLAWGKGFGAGDQPASGGGSASSILSYGSFT
jgi:hypothetical protein